MAKTRQLAATAGVSTVNRKMAGFPTLQSQRNAANALRLLWNGAVGFIDWLDFRALLPDEFIIKLAFAVSYLAANGTSLHVAPEDVELALPDAQS